MYYNVTLRRVRAAIVAVGKQILQLHILSVSVARVIQHAMRMRHIVICGLSVYTTFFSDYFINGTIFEKKTEHKFCVLISSTTIIRSISHCKKN